MHTGYPPGETPTPVQPPLTTREAECRSRPDADAWRSSMVLNHSPGAVKETVIELSHESHISDQFGLV